MNREYANMEELQKLANAFHSNKLSHAYLFEGDDAQSMQKVAINFAKLILCNNDEQYECHLNGCRAKWATINGHGAN